MSELYGNKAVSAAEQDEHQKSLSAKRVTDVGSDSQTIIDKTTVTDVVYIGEGARGLATSADGWLLTKIDKTTTPIKITHAIDAWDNYLTAVYT